MECNMTFDISRDISRGISRDTSISPAAARSTAAGMATATGPALSPTSGVEQQRDALRAQVDALHRAGALPTATAAGQPASTVQWNNWSNG
jgi:hypothetical protein